MHDIAWKNNIWYNMMSIQNTFGRKRYDWNKDQKQQRFYESFFDDRCFCRFPFYGRKSDHCKHICAGWAYAERFF